MLRITRVAEDDESATLKLEGRIVGLWVNELRRECEIYLARGSKVTLELSGVRFADHQGVKALKAMCGERVELMGASLFLSGLLKEAEDKQQSRIF